MPSSRAAKAKAPKRPQRALGTRPHPYGNADFRLSPTTRPERYDFTLTVDLEARRFFGEGELGLKLARPTTEVALHGLGLAVLDAKVTSAKGACVPASIARHLASETVVLSFRAPLPAGKVTLTLSWAASFSPTLAGLYAADAGVAITQFEAADARRVFPCFDEPAFKARWRIALKVPKGMTALSNGALESKEEQGAWVLHQFQATPVLSSYLIALAVGELVPSEERKVRGVPVRTWSTPAKRALTKFGQDIAEKALPLLEDYFGLPYAYGKVDQVGVPGFEAGAMENAGLITYRESALLADPASTPLISQKRIADTITHELAHQWYGNLVTMAWWDDLWLNEAFATWMATKIVDQFRPEWRYWLEFDVGTDNALNLDALKSTHPIRYEVSNAHKAGESFDAITYEKGAAILRMVESYLGESAFRAGIQAYMRKHQGQNAVARDLWDELKKASKQPVDALAKAWIDRPGFPLVELELDGDFVTLRQRRFFSEPEARSADRWPIPVILRYQEEGSLSREHRVIFKSAKQRLRLPGKNVRWVCGNARSTGFYRVAYGKKARAALFEHITALGASERAATVRDVWARVMAQQEDASVLFELFERLSGERDHAVLDAMVAALSTIDRQLLSRERAKDFRERVQGLFRADPAELGWQAAGGEDELTMLRRAALIRAAALIARDPSLCQDARGRLESYLGGDTSKLAPDLHPAAVTAAARAGDAALFSLLKQRLETEEQPLMRRRYLFALASFEAPELASRGVQLARDWEVPGQELSFYVDFLLANPAARAEAWRWIQEDWEELQAKAAGPSILRGIIKAFSLLPDPSHLKQATALLKKHPPRDAHQVVQQTLERMRQLGKLRPRMAKAIDRWTKA